MWKKVPMGRTVMLCAAYTPTTTGPDNGEIPIPYDLDGMTSLPWKIRRGTFRVQTAGGSPSVRIEKSTTTGPFSASTIGTMTTATNDYEAYLTGSLGTLNSNDKIRFNVLDVAAASNWTITLEI